MKNLPTLLILAGLAFPMVPYAGRIAYFMVGPMYHWNFNLSGFGSASYGLEFSWWSYARNSDPIDINNHFPNLDRPGYGVDLGFDVDDKAFRLYAEPQMGWVMGGFSAGPVLEWSFEGRGLHPGLQAAAWANFLVGSDLRCRWVDSRPEISPGLYGKVGTTASAWE